MPQAPRILSKSQTLALESCYLFLRTLRPFLVSLGNELDIRSRENLDEINRLAQLNQERLCESFPEIAAAHERWNAKPGVVQSPKPNTSKQGTGLLQIVLEQIEYI